MADAILKEIEAQGVKIRELKAAKAGKDALTPEVCRWASNFALTAPHFCLHLHGTGVQTSAAMQGGRCGEGWGGGEFVGSDWLEDHAMTHPCTNGHPSTDVRSRSLDWS